MSDTKYSSLESSGERLKEFITRNARLIILIAILLLVGIVVAIVVVETTRARTVAGLEAIETLEESIFQYMLGYDEAASLENLETEVLDVVNRFPKEFAGQRAYLLLATLYDEIDDHQKASDYFEKAADVPVQSHLVDTALMRAALSAERAGDDARATALIQKLLEKVPQGTQAPRALFNLGRLEEARGNIQGAKEYYERLEIEFPASSWTKLGKDRIILLDR